MNKLRKHLSFLLTVLLLFAAISVPVYAVDDVNDRNFINGDYVCFLEDDGTVTINRYTGTEKNITVPAQIEGKDVSAIGPNAFFASSANSIKIPNGVKKIRMSSFSDSKNLTSIVIPDSVTVVEPWAFMNCTKLKNITFSKNLTYVGLSCFSNTAWYDSQPDGVVYIGKTVYHYKGNMPNNTKLTLKNGMVSISQQAFIDCVNLTGITLPASLKEIGSAAFSGCTGLKSIVIPDGVEKLESAVFQKCTNLESITIPDSVTSMQDMNLEDTKWFKNQKDTLVYAGRFAYRYNGSMPANTTIRLRENTIGMMSGVFAGCENLSCIILPDTIHEIPSNAFLNCRNLNSIDFPEQITKIDECAFRGCTSLTSVVLPKALISLGRESFYGCTSLESVLLPNKLRSIESGTFESCFALREIEIPYAVRYISDYAFMGCSNLQTITFPKYLLEIGESAFEQCSALEQIKLPRELQRIGANAFFGCEKLKDVLFPGNSTEIGDCAFGYYQAENEYGDSYIEKVKDFVISGNDESTARQYAEKNSIPYYFVSYIIKRGDADGDEEITIADVLTLQKYLAKIIDSSEFSMENGDTDYDGKIDTNDVLRIQLYLAKVIDVL